MKGDYFAYFIIVTFITLIGTMVVGSAIGPGGNEIGYVVVGLSMVCGTIVACSCAIIKAIKETNGDA